MRARSPVPDYRTGELSNACSSDARSGSMKRANRALSPSGEWARENPDPRITCRKRRLLRHRLHPTPSTATLDRLNPDDFVFNSRFARLAGAFTLIMRAAVPARVDRLPVVVNPQQRVIGASRRARLVGVWVRDEGWVRIVHAAVSRAGGDGGVNAALGPIGVLPAHRPVRRALEPALCLAGHEQPVGCVGDRLQHGSPAPVLLAAGLSRDRLADARHLAHGRRAADHRGSDGGDDDPRAAEAPRGVAARMEPLLREARGSRACARA